MEDAPDIEVICALGVEDEPGKAPKRPGSHARQVEILTNARRAAGRMTGNMAESKGQGVDEANRHRLTRFCSVVVDGVFNILPRTLAEDDGAFGQICPLPRARARSPSKKAASATGPGGDSPPSSKKPRNSSRS